MAPWGRAGGRATAWDAAWRRRREALWPIRLPRFAGSLAEKLREWLIAEVGPGRLMPWLPIAFGSGIVVYFAADREPALAAVLTLFGVLAVGAALARKRPIAFPVLLGAAALAAGLTAATVKSLRIAHPVLGAARLERHPRRAGSKCARSASAPTAW